MKSPSEAYPGSKMNSASLKVKTPALQKFRG